MKKKNRKQKRKKKNQLMILKKVVVVKNQKKRKPLQTNKYDPRSSPTAAGSNTAQTALATASGPVPGPDTVVAVVDENNDASAVITKDGSYWERWGIW